MYREALGAIRINNSAETLHWDSGTYRGKKGEDQNSEGSLLLEQIYAENLTNIHVVPTVLGHFPTG